MKNLKYILFISIFLFITIEATKNDLSNIKHPLPFNKVIIWGHKLHTHTHSYIHYAFYRAFKHLGYNTYWFDNSDDVTNFDFSNSLFLTEGQVDGKIPVRNDCRYILHNCDLKKYKEVFDAGNCIVLQVYTHKCLKNSDQELEKCIHISFKDKKIYMPWGTDLLPYEIDNIKKIIATEKKENYGCFIGTINAFGQTNNEAQINSFAIACQNNGIPFFSKNFDWNSINNISPEQNIIYVRKALLAPSIQGPWQCKEGYIPCRIFKNISYGAIGITNSKAVYELFNKKILYDKDTYKLGLKSIDKMKNLDINELYYLMDLVRDNHTYINRINSILYFMNLIKSF